MRVPPRLSGYARTCLRNGRLFGAVMVIIFASITSVDRIAPRVMAAETHTLAPSMELVQPVPSCVELLVNGGFEQTAVGWHPVADSSLFAYATDQYVSGRHSLLLGFTAPLNITATFGVEQFLTLPAESTSIEFAFHYVVQGEGGVDAGDQAYLTIHDAESNQLVAMMGLFPMSDAWSLGRYDLTPLAGKNIRLALVVQNDGEPGKLAMRVDDVSILACLPPEASAVEALPTLQPTPVPPTPELMLLTPVAPTASPAIEPTLETEGTPASPPATQAVPNTPQVEEVFPQAAVVSSLDACRCDISLYACSSFSSWAVAQACYTQCQVTAGYDIHNLDEDRNGIACELELEDIAPLDAMPSPQPTPSAPDGSTGSPDTASMTEPMSGTNMSGPAASLTVTGAMTMPVVQDVGASVVTTTDGAEATDTRAVTVAIAAAQVSEQATSAAPAPGSGTSSTSLSPLEMLSLLLFSPLGYFALAILVVVGALSLWIAYMLGQRGRKTKPSPTDKPVT